MSRPLSRRRLRSFLRRRGATAEEVERATDEGWLALLTLDRMLVPGERRYTVGELAVRAGTDIETAQRVWRAIGFPTIADDVPAFTISDLDALSEIVALLERDTDEGALERILRQARVLSSGLASIAEAWSDEVLIAVMQGREMGLDDESLAEEISERADFEQLRKLIDHVHRMQLRTAVWRKLAVEDETTPGVVSLAVGFVDLVGYTALSETLDDEQLAQLVARFAELAYETVVVEGGRVVKTIGDEVMFAADDVASAVTIGVRLTQASAGDEVLPEARAGVAYGPVLARGGDYYGPVVNLASRIVDLARPGTVLTSEAVHDTLADHPAFGWHQLRPARVRDIGRIELWAVTGVDLEQVHAHLDPVCE